ncbi:unnamed protein product [Ceutorhynchus assimilis]|uniref:RRM domain-containing protein n=1 Tax=Ceutorhynchus assimilis TaxID=467358 RepID=A0A9N9M9F4_9CUCU|nr:unnamed protein product [Ceutorhynchus assimilis]
MCELQIFNLHSDVTERMLMDKFSEAGKVLYVRLYFDAITKKSLCYGFVKFSTVQEAERALVTMNGDLLKKKPIQLIIWRPEATKYKNACLGKVCIQNLDKNIDDKDIYNTFSVFGSILRCGVTLDNEGNFHGIGFVDFETEESANTAIERVNGMIWNDKNLHVSKFVSSCIERQKLQKISRLATLFLKNLDPNINDEKLYQLFSKFGLITKIVLARHADESLKGTGFVCFGARKYAKKAALALNGTMCEKKKLRISFAQIPKEYVLETPEKCRQEMEKRKKNEGKEIDNKKLKDVQYPSTSSGLPSTASRHVTWAPQLEVVSLPGVASTSSSFAATCNPQPTAGTSCTTRRGSPNINAASEEFLTPEEREAEERMFDSFRRRFTKNN